MFNKMSCGLKRLRLLGVGQGGGSRWKEEVYKMRLDGRRRKGNERAIFTERSKL